MSTIRDWWPRLLSREAAEALFSPHSQRFTSCVLDGFDAWTRFAELMPDVRAPLERTLKTFVNEQVVHLARVAFDGLPGVQVFDDPGFLCLGFGGEAVVHFKKVDDDGLPSSYPTEQQKRIAMQDLPFSECPEATWLTLGYHFKKPLLDAVDRIVISCCYADHIVWAILFYDAGAEGEPSLIPFVPPPPLPPAAPTKRVPVRAKGKKKRAVDEPIS